MLYSTPLQKINFYENVYYEKSTDRRCTLIDLYNFCRRLEIFSRDNEAITIFYKFATV